jgi:succinate dehydrogenase/fumarate reductase cytochrome b subunit
LLVVLAVPHVFAMRAVPYLEGAARLEVTYVQKHLDSLFMLDLYVLFVGVAVAHVWSGVWSVLVRFGVVLDLRAQRLAAVVSILAAVVTLAVGVHTAAAFHDTRYVMP